jgi:hypothetical protein
MKEYILEKLKHYYKDNYNVADWSEIKSTINDLLK